MRLGRLKIYYSGHVQGVGFRYSTRSLATGYDVVGTIKNLDDGRVELIVEGEAAELEAFRLAILGSELKGHIRNEQVFKSEASGEFRGFQIIA